MPSAKDIRVAPISCGDARTIVRRYHYSGKVTIHDYQLTSIGNALVANGYSFNSVAEAELAKAEELLMRRSKEQPIS